MPLLSVPVYLWSSSFVCTGAGLTQTEKDEGADAKRKLAEEAGERVEEDGAGSDDEGYKKANQFSQHMTKKNVAVRRRATCYAQRLHQSCLLSLY